MREQRVRELVFTLVCEPKARRPCLTLRVRRLERLPRVHHRPQQVEVKHVPLNLIAILAVVQEGHTVIPLREIRPLLRRHLRFREVPRRVSVSWSATSVSQSAVTRQHAPQSAASMGTQSVSKWSTRSSQKSLSAKSKRPTAQSHPSGSQMSPSPTGQRRETTFGALPAAHASVPGCGNRACGCRRRAPQSVSGWCAPRARTFGS
jgi:hypothetical protein